MSYTWPPKDPGETLDYSIDWSGALYEGDTVITAFWYIEVDGTRTLFPVGNTSNGLVNSGVSNTTEVTTIVLSGGILNTQYKITCVMVDSGGREQARTIKLKIRNR